tara:strand:+ start:412 stop:609 length:198 start_codon:yes stop_codon:yes gene_type:complete
MSKKNFSTRFQELQDIIKLLESKDIQLDEIVSLYSKGLKLVSACKKDLINAEQKITILNKENFNE